MDWIRPSGCSAAAGTMTNSPQPTGPSLRVIDAMDHPHGGRILRTRMEAGDPPPLRSLKGAELRAVAPDGTEATVRVLAFPLMGGHPTDARFRETRRIDFHVAAEKGAPEVSLRWLLHPLRAR